MCIAYDFAKARKAICTKAHAIRTRETICYFCPGLFPGQQQWSAGVQHVPSLQVLYVTTLSFASLPLFLGEQQCVLLFFLFLCICVCVCMCVSVPVGFFLVQKMASRRAKPSLTGDLLINTMNFDAGISHEHQNHGLLSPSTSISRSHEGGEDVIDPLGKPSTLRLSSPELGENTTPDTQLLTSHSLSCGNVQKLGENSKSTNTSLTTTQSIPSTNPQINVSEASKQQSNEVAQQPSSLATPIPSTPVQAQELPIELTSPPKSNTQPIPSLFKRKARRMAPRKVPTPPIPLNIHILALADRHAHPYASIAPKYTFTLRAVPDTTIREACILTGTYLKGHITTSVDSNRLEARDGNGHVFEGTEMVGQELGAGADLYLIEEALQPEDARRSILRNLDGKQTGPRTPKAAKKVKEPRKTPSERIKDIADAGRRMVNTEPKRTSVSASKAGRAPRSAPRRRSLSMAPLELEGDVTSPEQPVLMSSEPQQDQGAPDTLIESIESSSQAATILKEQRQLEKKGGASGRGTEAKEASMAPSRSATRGVTATKPMKPDDASKDLKQSTGHARSVPEKKANPNTSSRPAIVSQQHKLPPSNSTVEQPPVELSVVPDSQSSPPQIIDAPSRDETMTTSWTPINARRPPAEKQQQSATRPNTEAQRPLAAEKADVKSTQPKFLQGRPDPYDISAVLSDDEYYSPRPSKTIMSSTVRKLGSATKRSTPASATIPRNSLLIAQAPPAAQVDPKPPIRARSAGPSHERLVAVPSTPLAHTVHSTPAQTTAPSSALGPLLSSPTNHVAAALARGRAKARRQPQPECSVIEDSDVEVPGDILKDSQDPSTQAYKSKSLEASLPWSAPPLRMDGEDPFWTLRTTGRRPSVRRRSDVDEGLEVEGNANDAMDSKEHAAVPVPSSEALVPQKLSTSNISSFNLSSPVKDPAKRVPQERTPKTLVKSASDTTSQATPSKSPLFLVHGSSSSEQGVEEIGYVDKTLAKDKPKSPRKEEMKAGTQRPINQDVFEDENENHDLMAGHILAKGDEKPIEPCPIAQEGDGLVFPDDDETCLSEKHELPDNIPATLEDHTQLPKESSQLSHNLDTDLGLNDIIDDTPPFVPPCKRKRDFGDGIDSEEERRTAKKARREAKKAEKKRLREEKLAQEEEQRRQHQEERKRRAMEKAYHRARELELVVSSPSKAAELGLNLSDSYDSDQESELGSSPPERRAVVLPVFEVSDDSLGSKGSEESQSWRKLSKGHFSASSSSSLKGDVAGCPESSSAPRRDGDATAAGDASVVLADHKAQAPQEIEDTMGLKNRAQRTSFEDWAFLEMAMGVSAYSPLQVHDRIHMQMVLAALQGHTPRGAQEIEDPHLSPKKGDDASRVVSSMGPKPDTKAKRQDGMPHSQSEKNTQPQEASEDDDDDDEDAISQHTVRSPAPSPKGLMAVQAQKLKENKRKKQAEKAVSKLSVHRNRDNRRKKRWRQKAQPGHYKGLRRKHAFWATGAAMSTHEHN